MKKTKIVLLISIILVIIMGVLCYIFTPPIFDEYNDIQPGVIGPIDNNTVITQDFKSQFDILDTVSLQFANYNKDLTEGTLKTEIYDSDKNLIYLNKYELKDLADNSEIRLHFDLQHNVKDKDYQIKLTVKDLKKNEFFTFYSGNEGNGFKSEKNISADGVISIHQYGQRKSYFHMFVLLIILLVLILIYFIIHYKDNKIKPMRFNNAFILIISFINAGLLLLMETSLYYNNKLSFILPILFFICSTILLRNIVISCYSKKLELVFLSLAIPLGTMYLLYMIPGEVPDELSHFNQVYKILEGKFFINRYNDYSMNTRINSYMKLYSELFNKTTITLTNAGDRIGYNSFLYFPSAIGMFIAKVFGFNIMWQMYAGSFASYAVYLFIGYHIVKNMPFGKYITLVYLLNPMLIQQATSISCDAMINIMCIFFISYVLKLKYQKSDVTYKDGIILSISAFYVLISKNAYFPLLFLLPLLHNKINGSNKKRIIIPLIIAAFLFIVIYVLNAMAITNESTIINNVIDGVLIPQHNISELRYVMLNPLNVFYVFFNTLYYNLDFYIMSFAGNSLGALNISVPQYITIIYISILFFSCFIHDSDHELNIIDRILFIIVFMIIVAVILTGMYASYGAARDFVVIGVQGRYFIPIVLLILLSLYRSKMSIKTKNYSFGIAISMVTVNLVSLFYIINHFLR